MLYQRTGVLFMLHQAHKALVNFLCINSCCHQQKSQNQNNPFSIVLFSYCHIFIFPFAKVVIFFHTTKQLHFDLN